MKLIIYATGRVFQRHKDKINWTEVIALADKQILKAGSVMAAGREYPLIGPAAIAELSYDYVIVFSDLYFEEIRMELSGEYFILSDRIIPYRAIIGENGMPIMEFMDYCHMFCAEKKCRRVLDCGMAVLPRYYLTADAVFPCGEIQIDGIADGVADFNASLYQNVYQNFAECGGGYGMALVWQEPDGLAEEIASISQKSRYILFATGYLYKGVSVRELLDKKLDGFGKISCISVKQGLLWVIDTAVETGNSTDTVIYTDINGKDIAVYVATHRKYNCMSDGIYKPLCVGGYTQQGYLTEQYGDNIAGLNVKINECTALYWIWKNTTEEYIGLNHYRRFFYNNEIRSMDNYLDAGRICEILKEYDMIMPQAYRTSHVYGELAGSVDSALLENTYKRIRNLIREKQPDYLECFDSVMAGSLLYTCNMFVTRREILNRYCEWLFSFLIVAAEETDVDGYDAYSQRIIGFLAERMWTVWLRRNRIKIREQPYVTGWLPTGKP